MKRNIIVIIGIAIASLVLAACSSAPQATHLNLNQKQTKADKALLSLPKQIGPTPYQPNSPTVLRGMDVSQPASWTVVPGVNPNVPHAAQLEQLISNVSWQQNFAVYTYVAGAFKGGIFVESCTQGVPTGTWPNDVTNFDFVPTEGPAIPKGTPVAKQEVINGKKVIVSVPSPGGQHQPGPFYSIIWNIKYSAGKWVTVNANPGSFSCENHM